MAQIGKMNILKINRSVDFGVYLDAGDLGEILLPKKFIPEGSREGDEIEVFIYVDSQGRLIATSEEPLACVGDFAHLKVTSVSQVGAFLDWGISKDLLVPFAEQRQKMEEGRSYVVFIYFDKVSRRIAATAKINKFIVKDTAEISNGQEVELLICNRTDLGYNAIVNNRYMGILYNNELFQSVRTGTKMTGYIKKLRDDGKIDLSLQKQGYDSVLDSTDVVLEKLKKNSGFLPLSDSTSPEKIYEVFGISKKVFKKAIGALYKKHIISISDDGIRLSDGPDEDTNKI